MLTGVGPYVGLIAALLLIVSIVAYFRGERYVVRAPALGDLWSGHEVGRGAGEPPAVQHTLVVHRAKKERTSLTGSAEATAPSCCLYREARESSMTAAPRSVSMRISRPMACCVLRSAGAREV